MIWAKLMIGLISGKWVWILTVLPSDYIKQPSCQTPSISQTFRSYVYYPFGLNLLTRLCLGLRHLRGHKFKYNFSDGLDEICMCVKEIESASHFLLQHSWFLKESHVCINKIRDIDSSFIYDNENFFLCHTLFFW